MNTLFQNIQNFEKEMRSKDPLETQKESKAENSGFSFIESVHDSTKTRYSNN